MDGYIVSLLIFFVIYCIISEGQNIITGYAGQPVLCLMALAGIGAYTTALIAKEGSLFWLSLVLSSIFAGIIGGLLGLLTVRLKEDYLAVASIGVNFILISIWLFTPYFGGFTGITGIGSPELFGYKLKGTSFLVLASILLLILTLIKIKIVNSKLGLAFKAIRDDEVAAKSCGVDVPRVKVYAIIIGSIYAAIGGSLFASYMTAIHPYNFHFVHSVEIFVLPLIGGPGTIIGPFVGTAIFVAIPEIFRFITTIRVLVLSLLLIIVVLFYPYGLFGHGSYFRKQLDNLLLIIRRGSKL